MHVLATRPGGYAAGDGVVDLRQTPADVVILSAADTDLLLRPFNPAPSRKQRRARERKRAKALKRLGC